MSELRLATDNAHKYTFLHISGSAHQLIATHVVAAAIVQRKSASARTRENVTLAGKQFMAAH
jgi:hypothetical protein